MDLPGCVQEPVALLQLADLGPLGERETLAHAVFDLGALHPPMQTGLGDPEVLRDLAIGASLRWGTPRRLGGLQGNAWGICCSLP
jgi:hypothetical protein